MLSKEQILELLVLEQFLAILPEDLQALFRENRPERGEDAVEMLEELEKERDEPGRQVRGVSSACLVVGQRESHSE